MRQQGVEALLPHEPGDRTRDTDVGRARGHAAEGQRDVDVSPPIDQDAEGIDQDAEEGVGPGLAVGPGDIGAPDVGTSALSDKACPELRDARKPIRVGNAQELPPGNTSIDARPRGEGLIHVEPLFPGCGFGPRHYGAALGPGGEGGHVKI